MDPKTREFLDTLTPKAQQMIQALGSHSTKVSEILQKEDRAVFTGIQEGLDKANEHAISQAQMVRRYTCTVSSWAAYTTIMTSVFVW